MSHVEVPPLDFLDLDPPVFSPPLPQLSPPDMSSTIDSSNIPTDGTGKLQITRIFISVSNSNKK